VLVLLIVPSLLAMQTDIKLRLVAFRRMLSGRHVVWGQRLVFWGAVGAVAAVFAGTVGYYAVFQALPDAIGGFMSGFAPSLSALVLFAGLTASICLVAAAVSGLVHYLAGRRTAT